MADGKPEKTFDAKIVLLGNSGVGKTSLVYRYVHGIYQNEQPNTIGASFMTKRMLVDDWKIKLQIWDTAGQERFRCMTPMYYRAAAAAILVYDITEPESFKSVKGWVDELKSNVPDGIVLAIAGHKADLADQRRVSIEEAREYANSIGAIMLETSALNNTGIENLFVEIARKLLVAQSGIGKAITGNVGGGGRVAPTISHPNTSNDGTAPASSGGCCG
eukprot:TRINITY_DN16398_c0_g1_i1.p1 TRINITY_DN16398_c0_g1~~TRINITY_DN16398_c0_g1_i1.p1  ORF type:complete len:218 (+),score=26.01 TRINITY_DN16398_c0_g1_i1:136-789(+)